MRYIFPRQFGLHNVFTSKVDPRETAMPFMDYTLREKDIYSRMCRELGSEATNAEKIVKWKQRTPKRLRGDAVRLVEKLRVRNQRCSYMEMLRHYAPIEITKIAWLRPPGHNDDTKISNSDMSKRTEMFLEFVYWLFDSFLIPLVRTNFHVTESNAHRNRLFYFRHDVWRLLAEPALLELRTNMFEEMPTESTERLLSARQLGFSNIRLLPKRQGFRTIMNLKRRQQVMRYGTTMLGRSINAVMTPAFNAITYEKSRLLRMIDSLMSIQAYKTGKHVEISPLPPLQRLDGKHVDPMPLKKYIPHTDAATDITPFNQLVQDRLAGKKANTIFVNTDLQRHETKDDLMQLLQEHIERNVVKIGKRFYRQKTGIPQGSVLSSILCNFFYAQLERDVLGFALDDDSLLLRLLDDFLLISINEEYARRFVRVMHNDHPEYGVVIKPSKSLANFDVMTEEGTRISTSGSDGKFPYCGVCIDTTTLEISKKTERPTKTDLTKMPGQTFHRKALK
ncbi:hypothetical protein J4E82_007473 [Alternaria postmessia]|uniref:uncharacterized protein n=1 Tax=Alternaria postmessia TaxID=1187938 RepID=UPI002224CAF5|nr:uncharacterized protein J4E82_007473 [Alternaria postmessia]KAI5373794.1 hypothetical protein J4E82_007473 [Alternaria postmessia]